MEHFRGKNTKEHWHHKHIQQYNLDEEYDFNVIRTSPLSYHKVASNLIKTNKDAFKRKSILELGCAGGYFCSYIKSEIVPEFEIDGWDFSPSGIEAAKHKSKKLGLDIHFEERDFLLNPIEKDYGVICMFETIEHVEEGTNYRVLNNILDHCEYAIISTVDTTDDCGGEHISHYTLDTFEQKGYDVVWKSLLAPIRMPDGIYHYIIVLIKGKLQNE